MFHPELTAVLTAHDISLRQDEQRLLLKKSMNRFRTLGAVLALLGWLCFYLVDSHVVKYEMLGMLPHLLVVFGISIFLIPSWLKWIVGDRLLATYTAAESYKVRDCEAFSLMPGMELVHDYINAVKLQNRTLSNYECDLIIDYWQKLKQ